MILVKKHYIKPTHKLFDECDAICNATRIIRNEYIYYIRQHYFSTGNLFKQLSSGKKIYVFHHIHLYHQFKNTTAFRTVDHSKIGRYFNTKVLKQTQISVNHEFSNFYAAMRSYTKIPSNFRRKPSIPGYSKGRYVATFNKETLSYKKKGHVKLASVNILLPIGELKKEQIKEVKISPTSYGYNISICYEDLTHPTVPQKKNVTRIAAMDIGINNLGTLTSNVSDILPFIINGRPIKSINRYAHNLIASVMKSMPRGILTKQKIVPKSIKRIWQKRSHKIETYLHAATKSIIDWLSYNKIECLVMGYNIGWKHEINIGRKNNQKFVYIPFFKFKNMIKYKCEKAGILFIEREESYTSKCSFLDLEDICSHDFYRGSRIKRGMFKTSNGILINADVNGSYNILRKEFGNTVFEPIEKYYNQSCTKRSF